MLKETLYLKSYILYENFTTGTWYFFHVKLNQYAEGKFPSKTHLSFQVDIYFFKTVASLDLKVNTTGDNHFCSESFRSFEVPDGLTFQQIRPQQKQAFSGGLVNGKLF